MAITATMVNELRQKAGVGLMDCKKALVATNGDMDAAMEYLRKAGIAKADKKAGRSASEGVVETLIEGKTGVAVEILCETDFVARTDAFKDFCKYVARTAMAMDADGDISEKLAAATEEEMKVLIGKLGENMHVRRAVRWTTNGIIRNTSTTRAVPSTASWLTSKANTPTNWPWMSACTSRPTPRAM